MVSSNNFSIINGINVQSKEPTLEESVRFQAKLIGLWEQQQNILGYTKATIALNIRNVNEILDLSNKFIDTIDCLNKDGEKKYLKHRREITKAKFDTTFDVMMPAEAFSKRRDILKSVPWEEYETIQSSFRQLAKLSEISV